MAINLVQFQRGLSMSAFIERYGTEEKCRAALEVSRWPNGFTCPRCQCQRHCVFYRQSRKYFQCYRCDRQTSLVAGTIFQSSRLTLTQWFLAMHLITQSKNNVSALELMRHLGVSYRTAWRVLHKLMQVMYEREEHRMLEGRVEVDDAYLGGEKAGTPGRGSTNKIPFIAAVQTTWLNQPVFVRLTRLPRFSIEDIDAWANRYLAETALVFSDGLDCFRGLEGNVVAHVPLIVGSGRPTNPAFTRVNTYLGNLKTALSGTYHAFKFDKYAARYLAEAQYRFNRRFNLNTILARLLRAAVLNQPHPEKLLKLPDIAT